MGSLNVLHTNLRTIYSEVNSKIIPGNIKAGVTIFNTTGTYTGEPMKEYASEAAMNADIANIEEGEIVIVTLPDTTYYIKDTTMKKMIIEDTSL